MSDVEIIETCELAITHLTEVGWTRKKYVSCDRFSNGMKVRDFSACAVGALVIVRLSERHGFSIEWPEEIKACPAITAVATVIIERHPALAPKKWEACPDQAIVRFNDGVAKDVNDVIEILQETIKRHQDAISEDEDL